jgi:CubicO group peptidase (beta-lactamase class C family)
MRWLRPAILLAALAIVAAQSQPIFSQSSQPAVTAGFDLARLARMDAVINEAIADHKLPGAVVLVGRDDAIVWRKAYGDRALVP